MKVVILDDWESTFANSPLLSKLKEHFDVITYHDKPTLAQLLERVREADIIIPIRERTKFSKEVLQEMKQIKLIAQTGGGIAHIDMVEATRLKIPISTTKGGSRAVVELIFGYVLTYSRQLVSLDREMKDGVWSEVSGSSLEHKTIGIIGLGNIGKGVAKIAKAFGMRVIAWGPRLTKERADEEEVEYMPLEELLQHSHFVTLNVRLVPATRHLVTKKHFELMREDAVLINTSRGEVIDEEALVEALEQKQIAGACLDVYIEEPLNRTNPLLALDNVILTPHIGWKTDQMFHNFFEEAIENIMSTIIHQKPRKIVN
jgi:D-3-phosphoglycerate dehydrogenase